MPDYGQKITDAFTQPDVNLNLPAATPNTSGASFDLGDNTSPQAEVVRCYISITNPNGVPVDGYDVDVRVQWSRDNVNWPDAGLGQPLGNFYSAVVGAGIAISQRIDFPMKERYGRFQLDNNNPADNLTWNSYVKPVLHQAG